MKDPDLDIKAIFGLVPLALGRVVPATPVRDRWVCFHLGEFLTTAVRSAKLSSCPTGEPQWVV